MISHEFRTPLAVISTAAQNLLLTAEKDPAHEHCGQVINPVTVDAQIQSGIVYGLSAALYGHDLAVVRSVSDRAAVMYLGRIVEIGPTAEVFTAPRHPYTRALLATAPRIGGRRVTESFPLLGEPPDPLLLPWGCRFRTRCRLAMPECAGLAVQLDYEGERGVACPRWRHWDMQRPAAPPGMGESAPAVAPAVAQDGPGKGYALIPAEAYPIVAEVRAKPGKEKELRAATLPLIDHVRGDPKNPVYFLQEDRGAPGHFIVYEIFASKADFEAHNAMPCVQDWFAKLPDLADGGVTVMRMEILAPSGR
jgi:oligopeptide/dipeptide ABC transporter ATP-binding protein